MAQLITTSGDYRSGRAIAPAAQGGEVLAITESFSFATTKSVNDIAVLLPLLPDHVPVDVILAPSDGDTGTSLALSVGILDSAGTDLSTATADGGAVWIDGGTGAQTGVIDRPSATAITKVEPDSADVRWVAVKIKTNGSATACTGKLTMTYRAAYRGA